MHDDATEFEQLLGLIAALPAHPEIVWGDDSSLIAGKVWSANWIDVYVPSLCDEHGWNWIWTVNLPAAYRTADDDDLDSDEDPTEILLDPDRTAWVITEQNGSWFRPDPVVIVEYDDAPDPGTYAEMLTAAAALGEQLQERACWSEDTVNAALTAWCAEHAGRPDIRFRFDPDITTPLMEKLVAQLNDPEHAATYEIADGIEVSASVFDDLLAMDPEDAARLTETIKGLFADHPDHDDAIADDDTGHDGTTAHDDDNTVEEDRDGRDTGNHTAYGTGPDVISDTDPDDGEQP